MALFEKKNCSVCGAKIGLLGGHKLSDGNLCKDCAKKLSPWFSDYKSTPTESIRAQLADREENRKRLSVFKTTKCFGEFGAIVIDEDARVFTAIEDSAASLFGERKEITDIAQIIDRNPDVVRFDQVTDVDIDIVQTQHEEKQTVNGQQVSYNPKHITYMYVFYAVIKLNHPYIPSMRVQLNNNAVQIPNEGERLRNKVGLRLAEYLLDLPIRDVTKTEKIYNNNSLKDILTRNPYSMPDYSYGFKCSLRNREGIERYGYYLLMTQEILETVKQMKTSQPSAPAIQIRFPIPYMDPDISIIELEVSGALSADSELGEEYVKTVAQTVLTREIHTLASERCSYRDLPAQADRLRQTCETAFAAQNIRLIAFPTLQIEPGESARQKIELLEKRKEMAAMTPEDFAKRLEAAQKEAQAAQAAQSANSAPKFCPNCGTPTNGAKFCSSCGTKL
ncbi:MAG: DUF4428 domain-containing protein [Clostridia bacterium]|nr:DUF4428 domain-containing protein [Clostridia bacterium]